MGTFVRVIGAMLAWWIVATVLAIVFVLESAAPLTLSGWAMMGLGWWWYLSRQ